MANFIVVKSVVCGIFFWFVKVAWFH